MFEVTVEAGFSSGHYLRNYRGKCENPHGHNYKVFITLVGEELDATGLLLDFKLLKQVMRPTVEYLDHRMINELEPFVTEINPSAENLARYFYQETSAQVHEMTGGRVRVKDCTLHETDTSFARYYE
jgi:6-pyruvoyltetrahydropterin/6-carboxytetrahydropterin synthase